MIHLYKHFVLRGSVLLSEYWREACTEHKTQKEGNTWSDGLFAIIMKEYKNQVLSSEHAVATGDVFCSYLWRALKKPGDMTLKAFKAHFEVLFKLYDDLEADYELTIGETESHLIFFNAFSADHHNKFVQQQNEYHKMMMDEVVTFFQVFHVTDQPLREQHQHEAAAKKEFKDANQERDAADKKCAASCRNNSSSTDNNRSKKLGHTENLYHHCKTQGYDVAWNSCFCHNFRHPNYHQPMGLLTNRSQDKPSHDHDGYHNTRNCHHSQSHSRD